MAERAFPIDKIRTQFPALALEDESRRRVFLDNPAGTQVPERVIDRMNDAMIRTNANLGGYFTTTIAAEELVDEAHGAAADFYNAASPREIIFGQNMTTLTLHMSRCLGKGFSAGDEIVLSRMDHDGNVAPWLLLAEDLGLTVRWLDFDADTYEFADDALDRLLTEKTRLVAVGYASNCTGTINDIKSIAAKAKAAGALVYVDAVQQAPHSAIDVRELDCDFLVSSAYKFFGPHIGVLWGREELLQETFAYQVRPAQKALPDKFETGTSPRETLAGFLGAVEYIAEIGETAGRDLISSAAGGKQRREAIRAGFSVLNDWEQKLCGRLISGIQALDGIKIHGITSANAMHRRVPTVSFTSARHTPVELARGFAAKNIFVWSGHNYAIEPVTRLGLMDSGGVLRVGLAHYNTPEEVDRFLDVLKDL